MMGDVGRDGTGGWLKSRRRVGDAMLRINDGLRLRRVSMAGEEGVQTGGGPVSPKGGRVEGLRRVSPKTL